jgi:hypothetical protein
VPTQPQFVLFVAWLNGSVYWVVGLQETALNGLQLAGLRGVRWEGLAGGEMSLRGMPYDFVVILQVPSSR